MNEENGNTEVKPKKKGRGNPDNFKKIKTSEEAKERGKNGGIKSGIVRRHKKTLRECLEILLAMPSKTKGTSGMSNSEAISAAIIKTAKVGNVHAFSTIRDTVGEKPTEKVEHSGSIDLAAAITAGRERVKSAIQPEDDEV